MASVDDNQVFRLEDIIVREVSLVDRAANGRKFLIVKRDERGSTAESNEDKMTTEVTPDENGGFSSGEADAEKADEVTKMPAAMKAQMMKELGSVLSKLTALANRVKTVGEGDMGPAMKTFGQEMTGAARALMSLAAKMPGAPMDEKSEERKADIEVEAEGAAEVEAPSASGTEAEEAEKLLSEDLLKSVSDLVAALEEPAEEASESESDLRDGLEKALGMIEGLVDNQKALVAKVNDLNERPDVSRGTPAEGGEAKPFSGGVSWPLDLNTQDNA